MHWTTVLNDFSKTFDTISHSILVMKLSICLWSMVWSWIGLQLPPGKQCVVIDGSTSAWTEVGTGVSQGSIPILLSSLLTSWGSQRVSSQPVCRWYCYLLSRPWSKHPRKQNWKLTWSQTFPKVKIMSRRGRKKVPTMCIHKWRARELRIQNSVKYLEVEIDSDLTWRRISKKWKSV